MKREVRQELNPEPEENPTPQDAERRRWLWLPWLLSLLTVALLSSMVTVVFMLRRAADTDAYTPLEEMAETIRKYSFYQGEKTGESALIESALHGMIGSIDDHYAMYMTAEEYQDMLDADSGDYTGIGISIAAPSETGAVIAEVYDGGPMAEAGVVAGDVVTVINGTPVANLTMDEMLSLFHDEENVPEVFTIRRGEETFEISVLQRVVHIARVEFEMMSDGIGYIRVKEFTGAVATEFEDALTMLTEQGMTKLIVDVRNNLGGGLSEVLSVTDSIVDKGDLIVSIRPRSGEGADYYAKEDGVELSIVVLVNGSSASASELFAGALRDNDKATLIGTKTFGKGIVQSFYRLRSNGGWVKLTSDAYYTPAGVCIQGVGIRPDIDVEMGNELIYQDIGTTAYKDDLQMRAAISYLNKNGKE